eukprot:4451948-Alexandrium_andersonii.AAC.1
MSRRSLTCGSGWLMRLRRRAAQPRSMLSSRALQPTARGRMAVGNCGAAAGGVDPNSDDCASESGQGGDPG